MLLCLLVSAFFLFLWLLQQPIRTFRTAALDGALPLFLSLSKASHHTARLTEEMNVLRMRALLEERDRLKERVARLERDVLLTQEVRLENQRLEQLLGFTSQLEEVSVVARVILNQSQHWTQRMVIDAGREREISPGSLVRVPEGLIGRVTDAGDHTAQVMLITDPDSRVSVFVQRARAQGVFEGRPDDLGVIKYLSPEADVEQGDVVLTSGLGGVFPKGIRVGTVVSVKPHPGGLFKTARVRPSVDFSRLEEVICSPAH